MFFETTKKLHERKIVNTQRIVDPETECLRAEDFCKSRVENSILHLLCEPYPCHDLRWWIVSVRVGGQDQGVTVNIVKKVIGVDIGIGPRGEPSEDVRGRFSGEADEFEGSDTNGRLWKI